MARTQWQQAATLSGSESSTNFDIMCTYFRTVLSVFSRMSEKAREFASLVQRKLQLSLKQPLAELTTVKSVRSAQP